MIDISNSILINTDANKVWNVLTNKKYFVMYADIFSDDIDYIGKYALNERVDFVSSNNTGLSTIITTFIPNKHLVFSFVGEIHNGLITNQDKYTSFYEEYLIEFKDNQCLLTVKLNAFDNEYDVLNVMWQKALDKIKIICENNSL